MRVSSQERGPQTGRGISIFFSCREIERRHDQAKEAKDEDGGQFQDG